MCADFENPFSDCGKIVTGNRFIGRQEDLREIYNRVIRPDHPGNLAIVGNCRIGKSNLLYKALIEDKKTLFLEKNFLFVWI